MNKSISLSQFAWSPDFYSIVIFILVLLVLLSACALCYVLRSFEKEKQSASENLSVLTSITERVKKQNSKLTEKLQLTLAMEAIYKKRWHKLGQEIFNFNYDIFKLLDKNNLLNK